MDYRPRAVGAEPDLGATVVHRRWGRVAKASLPGDFATPVGTMPSRAVLVVGADVAVRAFAAAAPGAAGYAVTAAADADRGLTVAGRGRPALILLDPSVGGGPAQFVGAYRRSPGPHAPTLRWTAWPARQGPPGRTPASAGARSTAASACRDTAAAPAPPPGPPRRERARRATRRRASSWHRSTRKVD